MTIRIPYTDPRAKLCPKHRASFDRWADHGPHKPLPRGVTGAMMHEALADIKAWCAEGRGCGDTA